MLVLKHIEHPSHSEHWSELQDGTIHVTRYTPDNTPQSGVTEIKQRKYALKILKTLLRSGWIIMVNNLFTQEEL